MTLPIEHPSAAADATEERPPLRLWVCFLLGVGAALVGLLPWLVTGMRLPLQNLWAFETSPDRMPLALLPFSQYAITFLFGIVVTGAATAGLVARATRGRRSRAGTVMVLAGLLAVQLVAVVQTAVTVRGGLQDRTESDWYLAALLAVVVLSIVIGIGVFLLIGAAPKAGALIGMSIAAIAVGSWVSGLLIPIGTIPGDVSMFLIGYVRWIPPLLVGAAIAWCGVGTVGRAVAAAVGLLVLWIAPAVATGISNAAGSRVLAKHPAEMLDYGAGVFRSALLMPELALPPIGFAIAVAAVGLLVRWLVRRQRPYAEDAERAGGEEVRPEAP